MSTKFVKSFNTLTGQMTLFKEDRDDGVLAETLQINCKDMSTTQFTVEAYDECESVTIEKPIMDSLTVPLGYSLQLHDPYHVPTLRQTNGKPAPWCAQNLSVTAEYTTPAGVPVDGVFDVYSPDKWTVAKGVKLAKRKEVKTTDIRCITHLRQWAVE